MVVPTACGACRTRKSRCDGARPSCGRCSDKGVTCVYDVEDGEGRLTSLKQRHPAFVEKHKKMLDLFATLQTAPMEVVNAVIEGIRSGQDAETTMCAIQPTPFDVEMENRPTASHRTLDTPVISTPPLTQSSSHDSGTFPTLAHPTGWGSADQDDITSRTDSDQSLSSRDGSSNHSAGAFPLSALPTKQVFQLAVNTFNNSVGCLFHIYTPDQVSELVKEVFATPESPPDSTALCQLSAIAALGSLYAQDKISLDTAELFYTVAKHHLDDVVDKQLTQSIKICAILGSVNIVTKSAVTLMFFDLGLSMAHAFGLQNSTPSSYLSDAEWLDYKRVWRTLILCTGWISSTLGVVSSCNWKQSHAALQVMDRDLEHATPITDLVQGEMAKIAALKAKMLRAITSDKAPSPAVISTIQSDLHNWHDQLPKVMRLANLVSMGIETQHRHKIFFVHLLYLGALMLLQRCIMSHWITEDGDFEAIPNLPREILDCIRDGHSAAKQSARILGLLRQEGGVVKRCWICIFQSYTTGLIIIQECYQKMRRRTNTQDALEDSIALIEMAADVLAYCATDDPIAPGLLGSLKTHYDALKSILVFRIGSYMDIHGTQDISLSHLAAEDYIAIYQGDSLSNKAARKLLAIICRPFGDMSEHAKHLSSWQKQRCIEETVYGVHLDWQWGAVKCTNFSPPIDSQMNDADGYFVNPSSSESTGWSLGENWGGMKMHCQQGGVA